MTVREVAWSTALCFMLAATARADVRAGFATADITPKVDGPTPVYIAGYGQDRKATGVHDPLFVRAMVLEISGVKVVLAAADVVGLQYPTVQRIREKLKGYAYILIASTHNHEGPDVLGLWGPSPLKSGVDPAYIELIEERVLEAVKKADENLGPVTASYGTAADKTLLRDSRPPYVYDDVLRVLVLKNAEGDKPRGLVVQWSCHPESLGDRNTLLTADFPHVAIRELEKKHGCPVVYFSSAVGGLMTNPKKIKSPEGKEVHDSSFEYAEVYGQALAKLAEKAIDGAQPIKLEPLKIGAKQVALPLENPTYHLLWNLGALKRDAYHWAGDPWRLGEKVGEKNRQGKAALQSEVCYLGIGDLHVVGMPGELYPELIYGKYQEPAEPNADFPDSPLEPSLVSTIPGEKFIYIGLANDEVGYVIPRRQWDWKAPFCYGSKERLYGEINSIGSEAAPILMKTLVEVVKTASPPASP